MPLVKHQIIVQQELAQPQNFAKTGKWYPTKYNIYMDETHKHFVTLSEFVKR